MNVTSLRSLFVVLFGALSGFALGVFPAIAPKSRPPEITFIPRTSGTFLSEGMHRGANRAAREAGFRLYWNAPTREDDVDRQIVLMSRALDNNTKGLILGPTNGPALTTKINEFIARRIPIVVVQTDTPIPPGPFITSVTPDQEVVGRLAATRILSILGAGGGEVAILGLDRTAPETLRRAQHFIEHLSSHPEIKIVAEQRGTSLAAEAEQNAHEVLAAFPRLKAIFGVSATATDGAIRAIQQRGLAHAVTLVGCDDDLFLTSDLRAHKFDSLVISDDDRVGYLAAKSLLDVIAGRALSKPRYVEPRLLTQDDLAVRP